MRGEYKRPKGAVDISMDVGCLNSEQKKLIIKRNKARPKKPNARYTKKGALTKKYKQYMRKIRRWIKKYGPAL